MTVLHKINTEKLHDFHLDEKVIWLTYRKTILKNRFLLPDLHENNTEKPVGFI